jgi:hypothetical protein
MFLLATAPTAALLNLVAVLTGPRSLVAVVSVANVLFFAAAVLYGMPASMLAVLLVVLLLGTWAVRVLRATSGVADDPSARQIVRRDGDEC